MRIGVAVSVSIYFASLVEVVAGRRRNQRVIRHGSTLPKPTNRRLNKEYVDDIPRSLGIGLIDLKYGDGGGQHHSNGGKGRNQGKGQYYSDDSRGKSQGKEQKGQGSGKGYDYSDNTDSEDISHPSPTDPSYLIPTMSPKSVKSTNPKKEIMEKKKHKNSKSDKHPKLKKTEKASPTYKPVFQPTRQPSTDSKFSNGIKSI